ncbi:MAG: RpiB/LacA/LacB family sugar-phosphate isomerase [Acidobacteria bacterium]|nr:RpiB/LacA/LacB family sugar-phosphate isomerase [Acidobacteriota bacterium]
MDKDELRQMIGTVIREELARLASAPDRHGASPCAAPAVLPAEYRFEGKVLTAMDLEAVQPHTSLVIPAGTLVSPLVRDLLAEKKVRLVQADDRTLPGVALGGVRTAVAAREELAAWLERAEYPVFDFGARTQDQEANSHFILKIARAVSENHYPLGVFLDDVAAGAVIMANKFPGVRAAYCPDVETAQASRRRYAANVLVLRAGNPRVPPVEILRAWLETAGDETASQQDLACVRELETKYLSPP